MEIHYGVSLYARAVLPQGFIRTLVSGHSIDIYQIKKKKSSSALKSFISPFIVCSVSVRA